MKTIKIGFSGFPRGMKPEDFLPYKILNKHFNVIITNEPDYIFVMNYNDYDFCKYIDAVRIFTSFECFFPNFNIVDYAINCFHQIRLDDRAVYFPLLGYDTAKEIVKMQTRYDGERKKFCNYIYSHEACLERTQIFYKLCEYKKVDAAGKYLNNMNGFTPGNRSAVVASVGNSAKIEFQRNYKFSIAFENYIYPGYNTEKIIDAFAAGTIPVYYGDRNITDIFNPKAFINCHDFASFDEVLEQIRLIDLNPALYRSYLDAPIFNNPNYLEVLYEQLETFLLHIFNQEKKNAFRRPRFWDAQRENDMLFVFSKWNKKVDALKLFHSKVIGKIKKYFKR